jgi:hypothetical protein
MTMWRWVWKRSDAVTVEIEKSIEDFFRQEDISINIPNKKIVNKNNESKSVLQTSYLDHVYLPTLVLASLIVLTIC